MIDEEQRVIEMVDESDNRTRLDMRTEDLGDLSDDQERAMSQRFLPLGDDTAPEGRKPAQTRQSDCHHVSFFRKILCQNSYA